MYACPIERAHEDIKNTRLSSSRHAPMKSLTRTFWPRRRHHVQRAADMNPESSAGSPTAATCLAGHQEHPTVSHRHSAQGYENPFAGSKSPLTCTCRRSSSVRASIQRHESNPRLCRLQSPASAAAFIVGKVACSTLPIHKDTLLLPPLCSATTGSPKPRRNPPSPNSAHSRFIVYGCAPPSPGLTRRR